MTEERANFFAEMLVHGYAKEFNRGGEDDDGEHWRDYALPDGVCFQITCDEDFDPTMDFEYTFFEVEGSEDGHAEVDDSQSVSVGEPGDNEENVARTKYSSAYCRLLGQCGELVRAESENVDMECEVLPDASEACVTVKIKTTFGGHLLIVNQYFVPTSEPEDYAKYEYRVGNSDTQKRGTWTYAIRNIAELKGLFKLPR